LVAEEKLFGVEAPLRSAGLLLVTGAVVADAVVAASGVNSVAETTLINLFWAIGIPVDSGFAPGAAASGLDAALDADGGLVLAAVAASGCF
jgi:hypothetical protein